jgi:hypothetical protein
MKLQMIELMRVIITKPLVEDYLRQPTPFGSKVYQSLLEFLLLSSVKFTSTSRAKGT